MKPLGKRRCEILKGIRKTVAKANGIKYEPVECTHEGDCPGTCPQCEAEVRYLERELKKKYGDMQKAASVLVGSTITVGALAASSCSCRPQVNGEMERYPLEGDVVCPVDTIDSVDSLYQDSLDQEVTLDSLAQKTNTDDSKE